MNTTIVAIATPPGNGGVGIIRLSGKDALKIVSELVTIHQENMKNEKPPITPLKPPCPPLLNLKPRHATYAKIETPEFSDTVILLYFQAPNSFTGEDIVEIHAHGGWFLLQKLLEHLLTLGASIAQPGEFSRRAFLNGKFNLTQAESIIDTITAESESELRAASTTHQIAFKNKLIEMESSLLDTLARISAALDYPEHDMEQTTLDNIQPQINNVKTLINSLVSTVNQGKLVSNGVQIAIIGRPNVGKSSLFNRLVGCDRSIVADVAGTTRDVVSETVLYKGFKFIFNDTAGIRNADGVEGLGIERTKKLINQVDIVIVVYDKEPDSEIMCLAEMAIPVSRKDVAIISERLKEEIYKRIIGKNIVTNGLVVTNARHANELRLAHQALDDVCGSIMTNQTLDIVASDIQTALQHVGNISGTRASDAVLDSVFSRFCVGK